MHKDGSANIVFTNGMCVRYAYISNYVDHFEEENTHQERERERDEDDVNGIMTSMISFRYAQFP